MNERKLPATIAETFSLLENAFAKLSITTENIKIDFMPVNEKIAKFAFRDGINDPAYTIVINGTIMGLYDIDDITAAAEYAS